MPGNLVVTNGRFVVPELGIVRGSLVVRDGRVERIVQDRGEVLPSDLLVLDAEGRHVLPGFIDPHVHSGLLPPLGERLQAESAFAASGGITTMIRYFRRTESYLDLLADQVEMGVRHQHQDFAYHLVLYTPEQVRELPRYVAELGVTSFKVYMNMGGPEPHRVMMDLTPAAADAVDVAPVHYDNGYLWDVLRTAATVRARLRVNVHAEDAAIVHRATSDAQELGLEGLPAWHAARPAIAEAVAIHTAGAMARSLDVPLYFPHVGSHEAIRALEEVRRLGTDFVAETCPHFVALSTEDIAGARAKVQPPVRTEADIEAVWKALERGTLSCLGSDHIPYRLVEKRPESIWTAQTAFSATGLLLPVFLSEGVRRDRLTLLDLVRLGSTNPAGAFGLYPAKGTLLPGSDGDLVVIDEDSRWIVDGARLEGSSDFSVFDGRTLQGRVVATVVRGAVVFSDGHIVGEPGHGSYYRRFPRVERCRTLDVR